VRLAALVEGPDHVCCRYRLKAFAPSFSARGHSLDLHTLPRGWWNRFGIGRDCTTSDAVILQRKLLSRIEIGLLRSRARRLIFDFDDAVWLRDSYAPRGFESGRRLRRFSAIVSRCDAIAAGNAFLADQARQFSGGRPVAIIPTCVDPQRYPRAAHNGAPGEAMLVWIGSSSTLRGLEEIAPLLEAIGRANRGVKLKLICDRFMPLREMPVIAAQWSEAKEAVELTAADIGISWVPDDPWSRGKCGLKVLQYMVAGLPVVANPVGVQAEMIVDGETGFLARSERKWIEAIRTLASDPDLRRRMGAAGRQRVERSYSVETGAILWLSLLESLTHQRMSA
jgi:glycosyltransferase involved in cell wall biosynthesis